MSHQKAAVFLCLLLFFLINASQLNDRPITVDDLDTIKHLYGWSYKESFDLAQTAQSVSTLSPQHAPAYYLILNIWSGLAGDDLFQARLLSVYFALLSVALVYRLALLTGNRRAALAAPLVLAFFAYFQYYAQIARVYPLLILVCGWLLWAYWQCVYARRRTRWQWLSLFLAAAFIVYIHYFGIVIIAAIGLYHLIFAPRGSQWFQAPAIMAAAILPFAFWLPTAMRGFMESGDALADTALILPEAALTVLRIYANGLWFLPLMAFAALVNYRRRLERAEIYFVTVAMAVFLIFLLVNEITPILAERRMRYTLALALPLGLALAIALGRLPGWSKLAPPLLLIWIGSSFAFANSQDLEIYTNRRSLDQHLLPHLQDFIYEADVLPGHNELILSYHPKATNKTKLFLQYYRTRLRDWADVAHMSVDADGRLLINSAYSTFASPEAISEHSNGIWLAHNPAETSPEDLERLFGWLPERYKFCKRYLEKPKNIIDHFLKREIPCDLVNAEQPLAIHYSSGAALANLTHTMTSDSLAVYLRWAHTLEAVDSFTLQIFAEDGRKARQFDRVISRDPIDIARFDLAELPAGQYVVQLIVYEFATGESRPGYIVSSDQPFQRALDVLRFSVIS